MRAVTAKTIVVPAIRAVVLAMSVCTAFAEPQRKHAFDLPAGKLEKRAEPAGRDSVPKRTKRVEPSYPVGVENATGVVTLQVTVDTSGRVAETRPLQFLSIGEQKEDIKKLANLFAASATSAVASWEYDPARNPKTFTIGVVIRPRSRGASGHESVIDIHLGDKHVLKRLRQVDPVYPIDAQLQRIQGVVIVEATVAPDGKVLDARVLRAIPLLDRAALDAVVQWDFVPFEMTPGRVVVTQVWVNFALQ